MNYNNLLTINIPSPVEPIILPLYQAKELEVSIKRDDLIHDNISGNKWRKLKYNIAYAKDKCYKGILTFGGAFSNHLHACAFACNDADLKMVAIVRGDHFDENNATLVDLQSCGVEIFFLDRTKYRQKEDPIFIDKLMQEYPDFHIVPEGGNNDLGISGVLDMVEEIDQMPDHIIVSAGRGSTAIGIANALEKFPDTKLHVVLCVRDSGLKRYITKGLHHPEQCIFYDEYAFGGFAKADASLVEFSNNFFANTGIPLDPIYNCKSVFAFHDLIDKDIFQKGDQIMVIHTGGIQGVRGHNYRYRNRPEMQLDYGHR